MKLHRNAKTTPTMRALIVHRIRQERWPPADAAAAAGVSVRTAYKWLRRHRLGGPAALEDASSQPHRVPRRTSAETVAAIVAARQERRTAWAIAIRLQIPRSTVAAILSRVGLNQLAQLDPVAPVVRYEWARPGELVHLDMKRLARIARVGPPHSWRSDASASTAPAGNMCTWQSTITVASRTSKSLPDQTGRSAERFLRRITSVVCATPDRGNACPDRQSQWIYQSLDFVARRSAPALPPQTHPLFPPANQREGGTLHSNDAS